MSMRHEVRKRTQTPAPVEVPRLDNHLCFALYSAGNHMTRLFAPFLKKLGVTYPQYLVMVVLWERGAHGVGELASGLITIVVRNPVGERQNEREGNRLALANIRERLALMYGEQALVKSGRFDSEYIVTLRFPFIESRAESVA